MEPLWPPYGSTLALYGILCPLWAPCNLLWALYDTSMMPYGPWQQVDNRVHIVGQRRPREGFIKDKKIYKMEFSIFPIAPPPPPKMENKNTIDNG